MKQKQIKDRTVNQQKQECQRRVNMTLSLEAFYSKKADTRKMTTFFMLSN